MQGTVSIGLDFSTRSSFLIHSIGIFVCPKSLTRHYLAIAERMSAKVEGSVSNGLDQETYKDNDSQSTPPLKFEDVENAGSSPVVDAETERKLLRKLDIRIIPMICWIYLMNFMDRGAYLGSELCAPSDEC